MKQPLVYIIILNWNGLNDTLECLESLMLIDYLNYRVIVVDNGSKNNEAGTIKKKFPQIGLIENKVNRGFVIANNQGIREALKNNADYIFLLNNDTVVERDFLTKIVRYAEKNDKTGIIGPLIKYYRSDKIWFAGGKISVFTGLSILIGKNQDIGDFSMKKPYNADYIAGCALLIKREVIERIGLLDPIYFAYYEEADWCFRAKRAGYEIVLFPTSIIEHKKSASIGIRGSNKLTSFQAYLLARNVIIFGRKNLAGIEKVTFLCGQFTFKLFFSLINCQNVNAVKQYFKGLYDGILCKFSNIKK